MSEDSRETGPSESGLGIELYREYWGRDAEEEHNRRRFGQTYREVTGPEHKRCIVLCLNPGQRGAIRCPACYGKVGVRPMSEAPDIEPLPTRGERLAGWLGACVGAFTVALMFPFRVGRAHTAALIRDILQDAMEAGLTAEVVQICPVCEAAEAK